jgi:ribosomal protein S18 acetylase RimI-like enzyme
MPIPRPLAYVAATVPAPDNIFTKPYPRNIDDCDFPQIVEIERWSFGPNFWAADAFRSALRKGTGGVETFGDVLILGTQRYGYIVYETDRSEITILRMAVHPAFQRRKIGRDMIDRLQGRMLRENRKTIVVHVHERWVDAQLFFRACGFRWDATLKGFHAGNDCREDAYALVWRRA